MEYNKKALGVFVGANLVVCLVQGLIWKWSFPILILGAASVTISVFCFVKVFVGPINDEDYDKGYADSVISLAAVVFTSQIGLALTKLGLMKMTSPVLYVILLILAVALIFILTRRSKQDSDLKKDKSNSDVKGWD